MLQKPRQFFDFLLELLDSGRRLLILQEQDLELVLFRVGLLFVALMSLEQVAFKLRVLVLQLRFAQVALLLIIVFHLGHLLFVVGVQLLNEIFLLGNGGLLYLRQGLLAHCVGCAERLELLLVLRLQACDVVLSRGLEQVHPVVQLLQQVVNNGAVRVQRAAALLLRDLNVARKQVEHRVLAVHVVLKVVDQVL